jgi:hypothetical protein
LWNWKLGCGVGIYPDLFKSFWIVRQVLDRHHGGGRHSFVSRVYESDEQVNDLLISELGPGSLVAGQERIQNVIMSAARGPPIVDHLLQHGHKLLPRLQDKNVFLKSAQAVYELSEVSGTNRSKKQYLEAIVVVGSWDVDRQGEGAKYEGVQLRLEGVR